MILQMNKTKTLKQVIDALNLLYESGEICSIDVVYVTINAEKLRDVGCITTNELLNLPRENQEKLLKLSLDTLKKIEG